MTILYTITVVVVVVVVVVLNNLPVVHNKLMQVVVLPLLHLSHRLVVVVLDNLLVVPVAPNTLPVVAITTRAAIAEEHLTGVVGLEHHQTLRHLQARH